VAVHLKLLHGAGALLRSCGVLFHLQFNDSSLLEHL
jgi:hypothetical protein